MGMSGIVRCRVCRTYINPFVGWMEGGRRWRCNLCDFTNDVPQDYFSPLLANGQRRDLADRPELNHGCVEFVAPGEYMVRAPMPPSFVFVVDASYASVQSGLLAAVAAALRAWVEGYRGSARTRFALVTVDGTVHMYSLRSGASQAQMLVVSDVTDADALASPPALPDELLVNLYEHRKALVALLERLPAMFQATRNVKLAYGPALVCAQQIAKHIGGRVVTFVGSLPNTGAGALEMREDPRALGTDKEGALLQPTLAGDATEFYKNLALDCSRYQMTVDVVAATSAYADLATLSVLPQITGGDVVYWPGYDGARDGSALARDVASLLGRPVAWEGVMRVRCSRGLKVTHHHGHFFVRSTDLLALPTADSAKAYAVQVAVDSPQAFPGAASVQAALLYTTSGGERRIRVATVCVPVVQSAAELYAAADCNATVAMLAKLAVDKLASGVRVADAREAVMRQVVDALAGYAATAGPGALAGAQLAAPEALRNLPLYALALLKHAALVATADVKPDVRCHQMTLLRTAPVDSVLVCLHPRLYNVSALPEGLADGAAPEEAAAAGFPQMLALSCAGMDSRSALLLDAGPTVLLWVGAQAPREWLAGVFGVEAYADVPPFASALPEVATALGAWVRGLVRRTEQARAASGALPPRFLVCRAGDEGVDRLMQSFMVADHSRNFASYHEAPREWLAGVFGVEAYADVPPFASALPEVATALGAGALPPRFLVCRAGDEGVDRLMQSFMVADHSRNFASYHEFVAQLQRNVLQRVGR
eukprot:m51a1_g12541 Sec24A (769) ;mRNA; r:1333-4583